MSAGFGSDKEPLDIFKLSVTAFHQNVAVGSPVNLATSAQINSYVNLEKKKRKLFAFIISPHFFWC
jgi:hypothetical protein